jgi:hypothetical protein
VPHQSGTPSLVQIQKWELRNKLRGVSIPCPHPFSKLKTLIISNNIHRTLRHLLRWQNCGSVTAR